MVQRLDRFFGCVFGKGKKHYFPATDMGLEQVLSTAGAIDAKGIEVRFEGESEARGRTILPIAGPHSKIIEETIESIRSVGYLVNLHLSVYSLPLIFDIERDIFNEINLIIGHPHYEEAFLERLEERKLKELLKSSLDEREIYTPIDLIPQELKEKILIENGNKSKSSLRHISRISEKYDINVAFDIGHFVEGFYKICDGEKVDNVKYYYRYDADKAVLNGHFVKEQSARIIHGHAHGNRRVTDGVRGHYGLDYGAILTQNQNRLLSGILYWSNMGSYAVEVWRGDKTQQLQTIINSAENFEILHSDAKKAKPYLQFPPIGSKSYKGNDKVNMANKTHAAIRG
jgi:hypothetical protein